MMAEIEEEMARAAALKAFQDKLAADKAAAAAATAAYRDALLEAELAAFEAKLEAELAARDDGRNRRRTGKTSCTRCFP